MVSNGKQLYERRVIRYYMKSKIKPLLEKPENGENYNFWMEFLTDLCTNSSFHGLYYLVDEKRHFIEKILWTCLLICAIIGASYSAVAIWNNYAESPTETVVETTYFKYSDVAFPAIIICDVSRVHWSRVMNLNESLFSQYSNETIPLIKSLLQALSVITFGDFDEFDRIKEYKHIIPRIKSLKISDLLLKVMRPCNEVFVGECWWRGNEVDCCSIFELQKTELGYCYSFNSDLSEYSKKISEVNSGIDSYWSDTEGVLRPRKTGGRGLWSGLRVTVSTPPMEELPPDIDAKPGLKVFIGEPRTFITGGEITVAAGQFGNINIWGDRIYSTQQLRLMHPSKRNCLFSDEAESLGLSYYLRQNCKVDCYKFHTYKYCKCSPDFMFFELNENNPEYPACTIGDMLCLNEHNMIFNNMIPNFAHKFFGGNDSEGIMCNCFEDCTHQMYNTEVTVAEQSNSTREVLLDIHFRQATCILYRSDIMFGLLDLLVSFGGCAGLFLGGSLLSCIELLYFFTLRLYFHWKNWKNRMKNKSMESSSAPIHFISVN